MNVHIAAPDCSLVAWCGVTAAREFVSVILATWSVLPRRWHTPNGVVYDVCVECVRAAGRKFDDEPDGNEDFLMEVEPVLDRLVEWGNIPDGVDPTKKAMDLLRKDFATSQKIVATQMARIEALEAQVKQLEEELAPYRELKKIQTDTETSVWEKRVRLMEL